MSLEYNVFALTHATDKIKYKFKFSFPAGTDDKGLKSLLVIWVRKTLYNFIIRSDLGQKHVPLCLSR